jgi:hypothetical protein
MDKNPSDTVSKGPQLWRALVIVGLLLFVGGLGWSATIPDFMSRRLSFEESSRAMRHDFRAKSMMMMGLFAAGVGGLFHPRTRQWALSLARQTAAASAEGVRQGLAKESVEARLAKLDDLRTKGLVTDDEYAAKRAAILAEL